MNWRRPLFRFYCALRARARRRAGVNEFYDELVELEFDDQHVLDAYADTALRQLLLHAHDHTRYYHEVLSEAGVVRDRRVHLDRFTDVPPLTKDIIRERGEDLHSPDGWRRHTYLNTSGGSTGEPVRFVQDEIYRDWNWATALFYNRMLGREIGQREVKLWGSDRDILRGSIGWRARTENFFYNRLLLNSFMMTPATMDDCVRRINRFRPHSLWSYADSAYELARHVKRRGLDVVPIPVTIVTAGVLAEEMRATIERGLRTRAYNQYGSREVGPIACECPRREGLHVFERVNRVEIVDAAGRPVPDGETGEVCVTLLSNYSMPLIRYRIGDTAVMAAEACSCGRSGRLLKAVTGRTTDHFVRLDGTIVHGEYFTHIYYNRPWVRRFQVVQEQYHTVVNHIVADAPPPEAEKEEIAGLIRRVMGPQCRVEFRFRDEIPPSPSGKHRYTLSRVPRQAS